MRIAAKIGVITEPRPPPLAPRALACGPSGTFQVASTRVEYTLPVGQIGNEQPITVTSEEWVSDELGVVISSTQHDPMIGDTQFHLDQIARAEPDPSQFAVPTDYTVVTVTPNKPVIIQR
jgi:hypothetical protein